MIIEEKYLWPGYFRGIKPGYIITVCEGKGIEDDPYRLVYYLYESQPLRYVGKIDTINAIEQKQG